ncbi:MAG: ABC transporter ATP-binding protein [Candidatus Hinthialibacter sp.]
MKKKSNPFTVKIHQIKRGIYVLARVIHPYRWQYGLTLFVDLFKVILEAVVPILFLPIFYDLLGAGDKLQEFGYWIRIQEWVEALFGLESATLIGLLLLLIAAFLKCLIGLIFVYLGVRLVNSFACDIRNALFREIVNTRWLYYLNRRVGDSIDTINNQVERSRMCLSDTIAFFDLAGATLIYTVAAAWISYITILAAGGAVVIAGAIIVPLAFLSRRYGQKRIQVSHDLTNYLEELLGGLKVAKACRMQSSAEALVGRQNYLWKKYFIATDLLRQAPVHILEFVVLFGILSVVILLQRSGLVDLPKAAVTGMLLYRCFTRVSTLQMFWVRIFENIPSVNHVLKFLDDFRSNKEKDSGESIQQFNRLVLDDFTFHYIPGRPALSRLTAHIDRGEMIGIVGGSGAGKTTFVDAILAFLPPTSGRICVNGVDLQDLNPRKWRDLIGYVPQEAVMFNESVRYNITLGRTDFSDDDIRWAARTAHADDFIEEQSDGYETVIGKRGSKISGGQRQRLALARALIRRPQILILDEVTSAVDAHTEMRMQEALEVIRGTMTILVVAHRLATVMKSDRILVLDQGKIVESGSPSELIQQNGLFSELVSLQKLV